MKTILARKLCLAALLATLALSPALIPETQARSTVSIGANIGVRLPNGAVTISVGDQPYHYHDGHYFKKTPRGYVTVRAPRGAALRKLPRGYSKVVIAGRTYYRNGSIYYIRSSDRYIVVDKPEPVVIEKEDATSASPESSPFTVWLNGERELILKNGQFFRNSPQGLIWVALPVGATAKTLPSDCISVWYQEIEYFEKDGVHFKKTPDGYQVILPPWEQS